MNTYITKFTTKLAHEMMGKSHVILCVIILLSLSCNVMCGGRMKYPYDETESELTITVMPGFQECFFQKVKKDDSLEIEYQVIDANFGEVELQQELDITFHLYSPAGRELISDYKRAEAAHRYQAKDGGDYQLCFDNRHSRFSKKTIYFEVFVDATDDDYSQWEEYSFSPELMYNDTMDQLKVYISKVHENLNTVKHYQDQMKAIETRDRNIQEHNYTRVNQFSVAIIVVMVVVGAVQVLMVRSLFEEKSRLHKIFQLLS